MSFYRDIYYDLLTTDGHNTWDIKWYMYQNQNKASVVFNEKGGLLSEYKVVPGVSYESSVTLSTGTYSQMIVPFSLIRLMGNYAIHVFVPCTMIVIISWIPFWTDRHAKVERLALGVTTVLTMTTLQAETNSQLPRVSYVRSIDIYMGTCFFLVFAALIECTIFGYLDKRYTYAKHGKPGASNDVVQSAKAQSIDESPMHQTSSDRSLRSLRQSTTNQSLISNAHTNSNQVNDDATYEHVFELEPKDTRQSNGKITLEHVKEAKWRLRQKMERVLGIEEPSQWPAALFFGVFNMYYWWSIFSARSKQMREFNDKANV